MYQLDLHSRAPIYQQLKEKILRLIMAGAIGPGDPLPSVRVMARELGINPNTVAKAYHKLEEKQIIYKIPGKGCYITTKHIDVLIREEKLTQFDSCVKELKRCHVDQKELTRRVERIYGEEEPYA